MKKKLCLLCAAILAGLSATGFTACRTDGMDSKSKVKNLILFIGDGMGENHIENALTYFDLEAPEFLSDRRGSIATRSANNLITDSAAAATALATGVKVDNREIAYHNGENLTTISELAKAAGKKVGVLTTDTLNGATPAAFSSHAKDRGDTDEIIRAQLESGVDLFIGEAGGIYNGYVSDFEAKGYDFAFTPEEMISYAESDKLIATLPGVRSAYNEGHENDYQLKDMAAFAIEFLNNENGYFLMIESAHIDKYSHSNRLISALGEVRSMFDTITYLYSAIGEDTALMITADHETGRLEKAALQSEITNNLYGSGSHTSRDVPFFLKNFDYETEKDVPQNTAVFGLCKKLLNL